VDRFTKEFREAHEDSAKDADHFLTKEERAQSGAASLVNLGLAVIISLLPFITFEQVMLFFILTELVAIKDTLRKGLTRVR